MEDVLLGGEDDENQGENKEVDETDIVPDDIQYCESHTALPESYEDPNL